MKALTWFDGVALLLIALMSVAAGVATDGGRADAGRAHEVAVVPR